MTTAEMRCPGCGGATLTEGFVEDSGEGSQGYSRWIAGPLERGVFGGAKRMGKQRWAILAFRCDSCTMLSLFTPNPI